MLVQGTLDAGAWTLLIVLLISSLLNIAYLLTVPMRAFFARPVASTNDHGPENQHAHDDHGDPNKIKEAPLAMLIAIGITATGTIMLFLYPEGLFALAQEVAK